MINDEAKLKRDATPTYEDLAFEEIIKQYANTDVKHGKYIKGYGIIMQPPKPLKGGEKHDSTSKV